MTANARSAPAPYRGYAAQESVTGEGVALELPVANIGSRIVSGLIDLVVNVLLCWGLIVVAISLTQGSSEAVARTAVIVVLVGVLVGFPATTEALTRGKTLGKLVMGLRVVRDDGGPVSSRHTLTRALVGWPEIYLTTGVAAAIAALSSSRVKRLGDQAAGTYVVSERSRLRLPAPPSMPAELEAWAARADIAPLDPGLATALRQFLPRAASFAPAARDAHGHQLLGRVLSSVAPPPPPGHHPETVLRAVAAERYRRDLTRIARDQRLRDAVLPRER
ncbi:RDD family protein [Intrasporangium sp. YIM S08009]|uniref:RDD family protein n=1 Tax=Intrasporangium zincisolvens TaxID=3080018 RepID=UPI002B0538A7|nr:RDD family protein [Intrasporangium sp. YIM S08009]